MALVHKHQVILREIVQKGGGRRARFSSLNHPGVVLNSAAKADFRQHFQVVVHPLGNPLGFNQLVFRPEGLYLLVALLLDFQHGPLELFPACHIMAGRIDGHMLHIPLHHAGYRVDLTDAVNLVPKKLHPEGPAIGVGRIDLQRVPPNPELIPGEVQVVALVADFRQLFEDFIHGLLCAHPQGNDHVLIVDGIAQAVQAADGSHDNHIPPLRKSRGGRVAQPVNFLVDGGVLLNVGIRMGNIGFRLVVIVVGNKILHHIFGEKLPEFRAELGRQRLVVGQHQGRPVDLGDDLGHGVGLTGAGNTQKGLLPQAPVHAVCQGLNGLRLVAGGLIFRNQFKMIHLFLLYRSRHSRNRSSDMAMET